MRPTSPVALLAAYADDPERIFATFENDKQKTSTVTYAAELDRVRRAASVLANAGVSHGKRVHLHMENCQEFLDLWFACNLLGAIMVPTNPLSSPAELTHFIGDSGAMLSVVQTNLESNVRKAVADLPGVKVINLTQWNKSRISAKPFKGFLKALGSDLAAILYTSGTTSLPKGVLITNENYLAVGHASAAHYGITADDRWLVVLPFFHANAQYYCTMSALIKGASIAVMPRFSATLWGAQAVRHKATCASLFAAPIRMILANPEGPDDHKATLRFVMFAQSIGTAQAEEFERRFDTLLLHGYGMTETVIPPTLNPVSDERRYDSMGRALPDVQLRLVDDKGDDVPDGTPGNLLVRGVMGETIAAGYLGRREATSETFVGGWLHTGDVARRDTDGFYYFVDRTKDMIKRAGENVSAGEIERVVNDHPSVFECAAVGVPDAMRDEAIVVYVVPNADTTFDADALMEWCRERMSKFKVPQEFVVLEELPRTSVGKIRKQELRDSRAQAKK
ncbi:crotonobetaine/carnitine-CoA ligase [Antricoccus suffuscus]|uniref:Crotonobetaine/carnitine-CoA ligase n=1 Tax=Antricoccus suffuscus TaxID=1629062 RepID=A0A2T0ZYN8_9ACTN|nr:AMP-binding protein [Antricoccus suffuscus]PRZ41472.1 crotonobetaine/carnitine-CoA ligase [Antricoccus suffuscus]